MPDPDPSALRTILCVEDDSDLLEIMCRTLRGPDVVVIAAGTAEAALALVENQEVDLVLTDWQLPGRDGISLIAALRSRGCKAPVVLLTGQGSTTAAMSALEHGAAAYLQKPVDQVRLRALLDEYAVPRSKRR